MNEYDTELIRAILAKANYAFVPTEDEADIVMLNTCAIRENARRHRDKISASSLNSSS